MFKNGLADMGTYSETFWSVLRYFLRVVFEFMYVGLAHCGFVTLRRNCSRLILEHVLTKIFVGDPDSSLDGGSYSCFDEGLP